MAQRRNLKLASFDAGGARIFSQLEILRAIMHRMRWDKYPDDHGKVMLPCEHFDLMGGSDTGGLVAILFVKLRMSVEEVLTEFATIVEEVYAKGLEPTERTSRLKKCTESILIRRGLEPDAKLEATKQDGSCVGFALASHRMNVGHKVYLRTYAVRHQPPSAITIVEAILATCASQPEFLPACVNSSFRKQEYVGADLGASNPVRQVISEASSYFERGSSISLLLSLGSGHPGVFAFSPNGGNDALYRLMQELIVDNQQRALEIQENMNHISAYFRFSVEQGMQRNQHGDSEELSWIAAQTDSYLTTPEMVKKMDECVEKLSARFGIVSLDQLNGIAGPRKAVVEVRPSAPPDFLGFDFGKPYSIANEKVQLSNQSATSQYKQQAHDHRTLSTQDEGDGEGLSSSAPSPRKPTILTPEFGQMSISEKTQLFDQTPRHSSNPSASQNRTASIRSGKGRETIVDPSPLSLFPPASIIQGYSEGSSPTTNEKAQLSRQSTGINNRQGTTQDRIPSRPPEEQAESSSRREHLAKLDQLERVAWNFYDKGRYADAESLQMQVLKGWRAHAGEADLKTLRCMFSLATTYYQLGQYSEAAQLFLRVWEGRKLTLGESDDKTLDAMCNLAWAHYQDGRILEAESLFASLREVRPDVGEAHLMALTAMNDVALSHYQQRRYVEAGNMFSKVWEGRRSNLGDEDEKTLDSMAQLAWAYYHQGRYLEAEPLFADIRRVRAELGDAHLATLTAMSDLALSYYQQRRYSEAEPIQLQVLNGRKAQLGENSPETLEAMCYLAWTYYQQGRESDAQPLYDKIRQAQKGKQRGDLPQPPSALMATTSKRQSNIVIR